MPKRMDTKLTEIANRIAVARRIIDEQQTLLGQLQDLKPPQPPDNRLNANWKLLLQIAQHAGGG